MPEQKTILIVEDEAPMLEALSKKFSNAGFAVISAVDGADGLEKALKEKPDLVILDILMPKMNGMEAMRHIRADNKWGKDVPIIILTNFNDPDNLAEAAKCEVFNFLVKTDWHLDDIVGLVKQKLGLPQS